MELSIRKMSRSELDTLVDWAAAEGWNPGLKDADIFWNTDPDGFIAAQLGEEVIGGGSIVSYDGKFGFMGFFIVKPDYRGKGLGAQLWNARKKLLLDRLDTSIIGMDGVFDMQSFYAKGGFQFFARGIRYEGHGTQVSTKKYITKLSQVPWQQILDYDTQHFPAPREKFLQLWIEQEQALALGAIVENQLCGYGVIRKCRNGFKIGPLFANNETIAEDLFLALRNHAIDQPFFIDVPENNTQAVSLVNKYKMKEVFGCARMYLGNTPKLPHSEIFAITTFELG